MELIAIYFIIQKIKARTEEYEYNSAPHIKLAVILWLAGEIAGVLLGTILVHNWLITYLMAVVLSTVGGFFVYYKVMNLPKRNVDYFDLRQTKTYPFLDSDPEQTQMFKTEVPQRTEKPVQRPASGTPEEDFTPFWMAQPNQGQPEKEDQPTQRFQKAPGEGQGTPNQSLFAQKMPMGFQTPDTTNPQESKPGETKAPEFKVVDFNNPGLKTQDQPLDQTPGRTERKEETLSFNNTQVYPANNNAPAFAANNNGQAFSANNNAPAFAANNNGQAFTANNNAPAFPVNNNVQDLPVNNYTQAYSSHLERKEEPAPFDNNRVFPTKVERKEEAYSITNSQVFKFPYSELVPLNELLVSDYGLQTVKDKPVSDFDWFPSYKAKYESQEVRGALVILEKALYQNLDNGFIWLLYGVLYKDVYQNYEKALQFCLTGAKRCNTYKSALLTEAAEMMLFGMHNIAGAFTFFCHAVKAISENSKAWGQPGATGAISQERAFHYMRVLLTIYNFNDYRLYLERNVRFHTGLDQALIEKVIALCSESASHEEVEAVIRRLFPTIIEKMQSLV